MSNDFIAATLNVSYSPDDESDQGDRLSLEHHYGFTGTNVGIPFRQYPPVQARLVSSHGIISDAPQLQTSDEKEVVVFKGGRTATLKRPGATNVTIAPISGMAFDIKGNAVSPKLTFNESKQQIESDISFYGGAKVSYQAGYLLYFYKQNIEFRDFDQRTIRNGDTIHAFYDGHHASLDIDSTFLNESVWLPLYRIVSQIVLDPLGVWEYPKNWRDTDKENKSKTQDDSSRKQKPMGTFPGWTNYQIDPDNSFTDERTHQTAEYNAFGQIRVMTPGKIISIQEPYWGTSRTFQSLSADGYIEFTIEFASKPKWAKDMKLSELQWVNAYLSIDQNRIYDELLSTYPSLIRKAS
jgi:hypothetical protein